MSTGMSKITRCGSICKGDTDEQDEWQDNAPTSISLQIRTKEQIAQLFSLVDSSAGKMEYEPFERQLVTEVFRLGRLLITLFLCLWQERTEVASTTNQGKEHYKRQPAKSRLLGTFFGKVRYWRTYLLQTNGRSGGFYPVDLALGLLTDGFSLGVLSRGVRLATKMSFESTTIVFASFLNWSPSHKTIEKAALGMGRYAAEWVECQPAPPNDGEVLIIQFDSKATPTAREQELVKRRGPRQPNPYPDSPRHRGRQKRQRRGSKLRRKKGDKSKNGKMATIAVIYTLQRDVGHDGNYILKGPINRWVYASYAPKRHIFAIARREADKRGFAAGYGKKIQIITDGDEDLERCVAEYFPEAEHTLDVIHVVERLWKAAACLFSENSHTLRGWVEKQKDRLYAGEAATIVRSIRASMSDATSDSKRKKLGGIAKYMDKRLHMMNYEELDNLDLELSSGIVEGAVRYVIAQRFDEGGMRWIKERAEALLQLRCIEINNSWEDFVEFVRKKISQKQRIRRRLVRVLQDIPEPLPTYGIN